MCSLIFSIYYSKFIMSHLSLPKRYIWILTICNRFNNFITIFFI